MLTYRNASETDKDLFYNWSSDPQVRQNSYNKTVIEYADHISWFDKRIDNPDFSWYVFENDKQEAVGLVRIERSEPGEATVGILVDARYRGKGYSVEMLKTASEEFVGRNRNMKLKAFIFKSNEASLRAFLKAGYVIESEADIRNVPSYILKIN